MLAVAPVRTVTETNPAARMREVLAEARREGKTFDDFWPFAILRVTRDLACTPGDNERDFWRELFADQRLIWKAAYERRDTPDILRLIDDE